MLAQLIVAQVTNAVLNLILATLVLTNRVQPWHVYVTGFLVGTVQAFQNPARQILVNDLAGRRHLMNALALNSMAVNSSRAVGPAFAGLLIATIGVHGSYYVQAAMFLLATVWTIQMHIPERSLESARVARESFFQSITGGFAYVRANSNIRTQLILALGPLTLGMPFTNMMPIFAKDVLHGGAQLQGFLLSAFGIGSLMGALVVASIPRQNAYALPAVIGAVVFSISVFFFGLSHWVWLSLDVRFHERRFYDDLPDPGPGVAAVKCAATYPRPRDELLFDQPRDCADRHVVGRSPCPLLRRPRRRSNDEPERAGLGGAGYQHSPWVPASKSQS